MIEYDPETGMPLPPMMWGKKQPQQYFDGVEFGDAPATENAAATEQQPPPPPPPPSPMMNTGGDLPYITDAQYSLADKGGKYGGIKTYGPNAQAGAEQAQAYQAPSVKGQAMPQQFGTAEPARPDEGPLTPQAAANEFAERAGAAGGMDKLLKKYLLPMAPQASRDGYQNYVTASQEKRRAEKEQLRQQGALNRADAAAKDADAWDKTLALNALQGRLPPSWSAGVAPAASPNAGPVLKIGGYTFVGGRWRNQTPEEQANVDYKKAQTANVGAGQQLGQAKLLNQILQQKQAEADRAANRDLRGREVTAREDDMAFRHDEKAQKEAERIRDLIARDVTEMQAREKTAGTESGWIWDSHYDRGTPDWMKRADRAMVADSQGKLKPGDELPGSYQRLAERATQNAQRLLQLQQQQAEAYRKSPQYKAQQRKFEQTKNPADDPELSIPSHQFDIADDVAEYLASLKRAAKK